jgi:hypothetical protein
MYTKYQTRQPHLVYYSTGNNWPINKVRSTHIYRLSHHNLLIYFEVNYRFWFKILLKPQHQSAKESSVFSLLQIMQYSI